MSRKTIMARRDAELKLRDALADVLGPDLGMTRVVDCGGCGIEYVADTSQGDRELADGQTFCRHCWMEADAAETDPEEA